MSLRARLLALELAKYVHFCGTAKRLSQCTLLGVSIEFGPFYFYLSGGFLRLEENLQNELRSKDEIKMYFFDPLRRLTSLCWGMTHHDSPTGPTSYLRGAPPAWSRWCVEKCRPRHVSGTLSIVPDPISPSQFTWLIACSSQNVDPNDGNPYGEVMRIELEYMTTYK